MDSRVRAVAEKCFEDIMEGQVKKIKSWKMKNFKINPFTIKMREFFEQLIILN